VIVERPYQMAARQATEALWAKHAAVLDVLATGLGKTILSACAANARRDLGRTMFICHREELVWQAVRAFRDVTGEEPAVEMARFDATGDLYGSKAGVVVSTVQTQYSGQGGAGRMTRFDPAEFATLIVDEAHHYIAPSYKRVIDYYQRNPALRTMGITATPDRADKLAMGRLFGAVGYDYGIRPAIDDGWLVPVDQWTGTLTDLDLAGLHNVGGDFNAEELAEVMERHGNVFGVAEKTLERIGDRHTLVFAAGVRHGQMLTAIFNDRKAGCAEFICDKTPRDERREILSRYSRSGFQILVNVGICTEGFDDPGIECIVIARPTQSRCLYAQMIGRGTRPLKFVVDPYEHADDRRVAIGESSKPCVEIIDWVGNAGRHKLVTVADILGGDYDTDVIARVNARCTDAAQAQNITEALQEEWARAKKEAARRREDERLARLQFNANAAFEFVDPFNHESGGNPNRRQATMKSDNRPTDKQIRFLDGRLPKNIDLDRLTKGQAGKWISEIMSRMNEGKCTLKQAAILRERGLPDDVPMPQAKAWIDSIAANGWRTPPDLANQSKGVAA
jgi:superfamily II DNA or RNA helicase